MNPKQFRLSVLRPALQSVGLWSEDAEALLMGTAAQESHFEYVTQIRGPALSFFQLEPATHDDIWSNYLKYRDDLVVSIQDALETDSRPTSERLVWDLRYSCIMARLQYRRYPEKIPDKHDIWAQARLWKLRYNTPLGKGTEQEFVDNYRRVQ